MQSKFSQNLAKYRKQNGLTQSQLANMLLVTPQAVSKWEKGSFPDCELLPKIAQILDVSLDVLFGLRDEEGKIPLCTAVLEEIRRLPEQERGKFVMELGYRILCAYNPNIAPENASLPENYTGETFAQLRTDFELGIARLNPDMQYFSFVRIPDDGVNSYFSVNDRILELFAMLSDENTLRVISYAETLGRNCIITKECLSKELKMPLEIVSEIVDRFDRFGIMWELTANTEQGSFPMYGYVHNVPLVEILTLAESLTHFIARKEPDIDIWTKAPFRIPKQESESTQKEDIL